MPDLNTDGTLSILLISSVFLAFPAWAGDVEVQLGAGDGFVIKDSTATERWRVDESGNLTRSGSLFLHEGNSSLFLGPLAGSMNSGRIRSWTNHTESLERRPRALEAKGVPLSVRIRSGSPNSRKSLVNTGMTPSMVTSGRP